MIRDRASPPWEEIEWPWTPLDWDEDYLAWLAKNRWVSDEERRVAAILRKNAEEAPPDDPFREGD